MTKLALGFIALTSLVVPACVSEGPRPEQPGKPATAVSCGVTDADVATAARLDPAMSDKLAGQLTAEAVACARVIVQTTRTYGLDEHAAQIAVATAIADSSLQNLTTDGDYDSAGLFQQRVSQGWGLPAQLVDPAFATNAFLDRMVTDFPDDSWQSAQLGVVAQTIQLAAAADPYQAQAADSAMLVTALWAPAATAAAR